MCNPLQIAEKIDIWVSKLGEIVSIILLITVAATVIEVISRYFFNSPTAWAYEIEMFTCGVLYVLVGAYVLQKDGHVGVDMFYRNMPRKWQLIMNILVIYPLILVMMVLLVYIGFKFAWSSYIIKERSYTNWAPLLWPVKVSLPIGSTLMVLQLFSKIIRDIYILRGNS